MPYITSSIIIQLLVVVIPRLERLKEQGQSGQAKITQYTRYLTVALAILQSTGIVALARSGRLLQCPDSTGNQISLLHSTSVFRIITLVVTMTAGTAVIMWFGELITDRGIGNGMSLLIFTSIAARFPSQGSAILQEKGAGAFIVVLLVGVLIIVGIVFMEQGQRRIPVQYAKRMIGRRMYGGTSTYIPLKVNQAGVIPVIFSSSLLYLPQLLGQVWTSNHGFTNFVTTYFSPNNPNWTYILTYAAADDLLHVLLCRDHVQPGRGQRQHAQVRRLHPRHPPGSADRGIPRIRAVSDHPARRAVPDRDRGAADPRAALPAGRPARAPTRRSPSVVPRS